MRQKKKENEEVTLKTGGGPMDIWRAQGPEGLKENASAGHWMIMNLVRAMGNGFVYLKNVCIMPGGEKWMHNEGKDCKTHQHPYMDYISSGDHGTGNYGSAPCYRPQNILSADPESNILNAELSAENKGNYTMPNTQSEDGESISKSNATISKDIDTDEYHREFLKVAEKTPLYLEMSKKVQDDLFALKFDANGQDDFNTAIAESHLRWNRAVEKHDVANIYYMNRDNKRVTAETAKAYNDAVEAFDDFAASLEKISPAGEIFIEANHLRLTLYCQTFWGTCYQDFINNIRTLATHANELSVLSRTAYRKPDY